MKKILNIVFVSLLTLSSFAINWQDAITDYKPNSSKSNVRNSYVVSKTVNPIDFNLIAPEKGMVRRSYSYWPKNSGSKHDTWFDDVTSQMISNKITPVELNIDTSGQFLGNKAKHIEMFTGSLQIKNSGYYTISIQKDKKLVSWYCYRLYINGNEVIPSTYDDSVSIRVYLHAGFNEFKFLAEFRKYIEYKVTLRKENSLKTYSIGPANFYYESDTTGNCEEEEDPFL